ncbi:hypothetical protein NMY22_g13387 [Coprinellus aureogranulatus]|nr:hypothetical protein NMY22_g13387 [Coprinellus aureogranulatus]
MTATAEPPARPDEVYFWELITFSVGGLLFRLPKCRFIVGSPVFAEWVSNRESDDSPIKLEDVRAADFRIFLKLFFPTHETSTTLHLSKVEWLVILNLSTKWHFARFRKLALEELDVRFTDPVELITLGRAAYAHLWALAGYGALATSPNSISGKQSESIGDRTADRVYIVRHVRQKSEGTHGPSTQKLLGARAKVELDKIVGDKDIADLANEEHQLIVQLHELEEQRGAEEDAVAKVARTRENFAAKTGSPYLRSRAEQVMDRKRLKRITARANGITEVQRALSQCRERLAILKESSTAGKAY